MAQETQPGALYQPRGVGWEADGREFRKGGDICIPIADSCWGLTENSKILYSNYPSIKNKLIKKNENYLGHTFFPPLTWFLLCYSLNFVSGDWNRNSVSVCSVKNIF